MLLKLNTEMQMWATVISHVAENKVKRPRARQKFFNFYFRDYLNICHFYSKSFQELLLFMIYYSY